MNGHLKIFSLIKYFVFVNNCSNLDEVVQNPDLLEAQNVVFEQEAHTKNMSCKLKIYF